MEAYTDFAYVYDKMMKDIPYDEWADYTMSLLAGNEIKAGASITELGCGTGSFTMEMCKLGYRMTGIDISTDMLSVARDKFENSSYRNIVLSQQDMTDFALPQKADAFVCVCDSLNYLIEEGSLEKMFQCILANMKKSGVAIIDMKTRYFYENVLAYNTLAENFDDCSYIWDNYYHEEEHINEYILTVFAKEDKLYRKFEENHFQRAYTINEVLNAAKEAGFATTKVYDAFTMNKPDKISERVYFVFGR